MIELPGIVLDYRSMRIKPMASHGAAYLRSIPVELSSHCGNFAGHDGVVDVMPKPHNKFRQDRPLTLCTRTLYPDVHRRPRARGRSLRVGADTR